MFRQELYLESPWLNAAGMLGFLPPARWPVPEAMGAFITNPISQAPRTPAAERSLVEYPGGVLLHSGLPNPGLGRVVRRYGARWSQSSLPIWVHLIGAAPDDIRQMVRRLEGQEGIMAIELGLPPESSGEEALAFIEAAYGELPLVAHLPLNRSREPWVKELPGLGVSAISLGAPRGILTNAAGRQVSGRLYGPSLLPLMLAAVQSVRRLGIQIIAGAGVFHRRDAQTLREAGAWAVQLDTVLWRGWADGD
jgi:dihydroorotate dehydrogenase (NAD+) catalytic subunit